MEIIVLISGLLYFISFSIFSVAIKRDMKKAKNIIMVVLHYILFVSALFSSFLIKTDSARIGIHGSTFTLELLITLLSFFVMTNTYKISMKTWIISLSIFIVIAISINYINVLKQADSTLIITLAIITFFETLFVGIFGMVKTLKRERSK